MLTPPGFSVMSPLPYLSNKLITYLSTLLRNQNTINITHQFDIWKPEFYNRTASVQKYPEVIIHLLFKKKIGWLR